MKTRSDELKFREFTALAPKTRTIAAVYYVGPKDEKMRTTTCVVVTPEHGIGIGSAVCSSDDNFNLTEGRDKSIEKALADLDKGRKLINPKPTVSYLKLVARYASISAHKEAIKAKTRYFARNAAKYVRTLTREIARYPIDSQEVVRLAVLYQNADKAKLSDYGKL